MKMRTDTIIVPLRELRFDFVRSSGPGGQNVNKVNSKAVLRWDVVASSALPEGVRARFMARFSNRMDSHGELLISSDRFREQRRNVDDCIDKLRSMLLEVARPPKVRKPSRPGRAARERRLARKRAVAEKKRRRTRVSRHGDD